MSQRATRDFSEWAVGWTVFAGVMMIIVGTFDVIQGLVAVINDDFYVVTQEWILEFSTTTWGWIHILIGLILIASGIGVFSANVAARTVGVIAASLAMITNFAWLPYYPVWSLTAIAVCIAVIWALTVHGRDVTQA